MSSTVFGPIRFWTHYTLGPLDFGSIRFGFIRLWTHSFLDRLYFEPLFLDPFVFGPIRLWTYSILKPCTLTHTILWTHCSLVPLDFAPTGLWTHYTLHQHSSIFVFFFDTVVIFITTDTGIISCIIVFIRIV